MSEVSEEYGGLRFVKEGVLNLLFGGGRVEEEGKARTKHEL
jgi:hypothetical protein